MRTPHTMLSVGLGLLVTTTCQALSLLGTIDQPSLISGTFLSEHSKESKRLTNSQLGVVVGWLHEYRSGWQINVATEPVPLMSVSLDGVNRRGALALRIWRVAGSPAGQMSVLVEIPVGHPVGIQRFSADDVRPLIQIAQP